MRLRRDAFCTVRITIACISFTAPTTKCNESSAHVSPERFLVKFHHCLLSCSGSTSDVTPFSIGVDEGSATLVPKGLPVKHHYRLLELWTGSDESRDVRSDIAKREGAT